MSVHRIQLHLVTHLSHHLCHRTTVSPVLLCFVSAVVHTRGNLALHLAQLMKLSGVADGVLKWLQVCVCMCRYLHTCMVH